MKKQLAFTLLMVSIIGANVFAQDAPKSAVKKKDNKVKALPEAPAAPAQAAPAQPVVNGGVPPAQKTGQSTSGPVKPVPQAAPDTKRPKTSAQRAPIPEKIADPVAQPQPQK